MKLTICSAKELEHYQKVRETFEGPSSSGSDTARALVSQFNPQHPEMNGAGQRIPPKPKPITRHGTKATDKGKGKAVAKQWNSGDDEEDDDDDDDEAYFTSNNYGTPARYASSNGSAKGKGKAVARDYRSGDDGLGDVFTDGSSKGKGKGKAVMRDRQSDGDDADDFGDAAGDDEEELYG